MSWKSWRLNFCHFKSIVSSQKAPTLFNQHSHWELPSLLRCIFSSADNGHVSSGLLITSPWSWRLIERRCKSTMSGIMTVLSYKVCKRNEDISCPNASLKLDRDDASWAHPKLQSTTTCSHRHDGFRCGYLSSNKRQHPQPTKFCTSELHFFAIRRTFAWPKLQISDQAQVKSSSRVASRHDSVKRRSLPRIAVSAPS